MRKYFYLIRDPLKSVPVDLNLFVNGITVLKSGEKNLIKKSPVT